MDKYPLQLSKASNKDKYLISKKLLEECFASLMSNHQMEYEGSPMSYEERIQQLTHELETLKQINNDLLEEIKNVKKQTKMPEKPANDRIFRAELYLWVYCVKINASLFRSRLQP